MGGFAYSPANPGSGRYKHVAETLRTETGGFISLVTPSLGSVALGRLQNSEALQGATITNFYDATVVTIPSEVASLHFEWEQKLSPNDDVTTCNVGRFIFYITENEGNNGR